MEHTGYLLIATGVAALIGGITNHLAIRMLFHPRCAVYIGRWRVPFTPGLIPKRKEDIGVSLGQVVADYLVTSQGLVEALRKPELRHKLETKLAQWIERWSDKDEAIEQSLVRIWGAELLEARKADLSRLLGQLSERTVEWLWVDRGWANKPLKEWVPGWSEANKAEFAEWGAAYLLDEVRKELLTPKGDLLLRRLLTQTMEQAGGLLGTLAGIFMDEDKMTQKVKSVLLDRLDSPAIREAVSQFFIHQATKLEQMTLGELAASIAKQEADQWLKEKLPEWLKWDKLLNQAGNMRWVDVLSAQKSWLLGTIPWLIDTALKTLETNADKMIRAIQLPRLVEEQVSQFPIERLEHIILSVSGKEFRAITWLGAALGGLIGFIQGLLFLWYR